MTTSAPSPFYYLNSLFLLFAKDRLPSFKLATLLFSYRAASCLTSTHQSSLHPLRICIRAALSMSYLKNKIYDLYAYKQDIEPLSFPPLLYFIHRSDRFVQLASSFFTPSFPPHIPSPTISSFTASSSIIYARGHFVPPKKKLQQDYRHEQRHSFSDVPQYHHVRLCLLLLLLLLLSLEP